MAFPLLSSGIFSGIVPLEAIWNIAAETLVAAVSKLLNTAVVCIVCLDMATCNGVASAVERALAPPKRTGATGATGKGTKRRSPPPTRTGATVPKGKKRKSPDVHLSALKCAQHFLDESEHHCNFFLSNLHLPTSLVPTSSLQYSNGSKCVCALWTISTQQAAVQIGSRNGRGASDGM